MTPAVLEAAAQRIRGHVRETPLLSSPGLDAALGRRVLVKAECLQHTGSFKYRGAKSAITALMAGTPPAGIIAFSIHSALINRDRYSSLLTIGVAGTFFLFFAINMAMVKGLMPVVGVPLPLVSYGGTAMMILLAAFGLVQSANIHRPR